MVLEDMAYAIARGVTRAYLDVLAERKTASEEKKTDADKDRADNLADAVDRLRGGEAGPGHP